MSASLLERAQQLALGVGLGALAITPLAADAALLTSKDLEVQGSGAYFYNASGYFADWSSATRPAGGSVQELNADGSAKFYGSASAGAADFSAHNCVDDSCARVGARGVALVWWGTLASPARAGDQLKVHYDMRVDTGLLGGTWSVTASLMSWMPSNSVGGGQSDYVYGYLDAGSEPTTVLGDFHSRALEEWHLGGDTLYWQIVATATGNLGDWNRDASTYGYTDIVSLVVPSNSIDVSVFNALDLTEEPEEPGEPGNAVPVPASLALALLGLGLMPRRRKAEVRGPRLLLALPQSLFDRSSGAAVSMRHLACQLARQGWQVRLLCTTATESGRAGLPLPAEDLGGAELELISLPEGAGRDWARFDSGQFERRTLELLRSFRPQLFLSYGADALEHRLCAAARACGAKVLLALHNLVYLQLRLPPCDAVLLPSRFMAERYAGHLPVPALMLPPPIWDADVLAAENEPVYATFVNPEPEKGAARIAWLAAACPQQPFLVVEGRAGSTAFVSAARQAGVDPAALGNVHLLKGERPVRELLAVTRVLLMPSQVEEAAGRLAAEAIANGIPALVSDRGGLPEMVEGTAGLIAEAADEAGSRERWRQALLALGSVAGWKAAAEQAAVVAPRWRTAWQAPRAAAALAALLR